MDGHAGIEPMASRMLSGCDTTTQRARWNKLMQLRRGNSAAGMDLSKSKREYV